MLFVDISERVEKLAAAVAGAAVAVAALTGNGLVSSVVYSVLSISSFEPPNVI